MLARELMLEIAYHVVRPALHQGDELGLVIPGYEQLDDVAEM